LFYCITGLFPSPDFKGITEISPNTSLVITKLRLSPQDPIHYDLTHPTDFWNEKEKLELVVVVVVVVVVHI
jgi:hypothetical protein